MSLKKTQSNQREVFSTKIGFILSCVGAALGLGNIWMFSYRLGTYGGAAFLIPYFIFIFLLGTTGLMTEFTFGRTFKAGSITGIKKVFESRNLKGASLISVIPVLGATGTLMFYTIVIGWILKYFALSISGEMTTINPGVYFETFAGTKASIPWFLLAMMLTLLIVGLGVSKGIEKLNKLILPVLLLIFIILTVRSVTLPGAMAGVDYLLKPRWEYLLQIETWVMPLGQAFFSVSLSGCSMVVYGSYTDENFDIVSSSFKTAVFDTLAALLAAFMIMPAVFAFGLNPSAGPSLLFITLPEIFKSMPYGNVMSSLFFLSIIFAAVSSSVSMLEGPVDAILSITNISRKKASFIIAISCFVLALPLAMNSNLFGSFADFVSIILTPIGATIVAITVFYLYKGDILQEFNKGAKKPLKPWFISFGKYVFVPVTLLVIILGLVYGGIG
ncbi:MAG: sodium-dependent transporter [Turicibacter sp.]